LFTTQEQRDEAKREQVHEIPITQIDSFPGHPFQVKLDEAMHTLADSIKAYGIQTPAVVVKKDDGRYELVSGHRRKMACYVAKLETMPCIIRELNRDEAIIAMVDANLQRETILPSEKAKSYKMKMDAMSRQGQRTDLTSRPVGEKWSVDQISEKAPDSSRQVHRYIRLNELIPQLLDMVDNCVTREKSQLQIALRPAVELSYLSQEHQQLLLEEMVAEDKTPSHEQTIKMRRYSEEGRLGEDVIHSIMQEEKPNQVIQFKMPQERLNKFFPEGTPAQKIEEAIIRGLELLRQRERNRAGEAR